VSVLSFGCGAVGGLMTRGEPRDQERAVARALELGITYFDSAALYGNGASETNLGRVLAKLKPSPVIVATKVRIPAADRGRIGAAIAGSLEASLKRLGRDHVDIFYCHNTIAAGGGGNTITRDQLLEDALPAFERLRKEGKARHIGISALGDTPLLLEVADSGAFDVAQICFNALNPTAGEMLPAGYPAQDYQGLMQRAHKAGMGTVGIRVMAGGALSGSALRHPAGHARRRADRLRRRLRGRLCGARSGWSRWCARAMREASPSWRCALPSPIPRSRPRSSASPISSSSRQRQAPRRRARSRQRRWRG
jgi:aryl-alcohol dehydrogenase-like predicted oxidoreductase